MSTLLPKDVNKYKVSRRGGRKLQVSEDSRTLLALPKDIPERTWAEILQREENEIICLEIREDIVEDALQEGYERYMERQTALFTVHCAAKAWLRLIDWHFYRHDPGEDPSAAPPCYIPRRAESWIPDELPAPCVKDSWGRQELEIVEDCADDPLPIKSRADIDLTVVESVPPEYWFPGRVNLTVDYVSVTGERKRHVMADGLEAKSVACSILVEKSSVTLGGDAPSFEDLSVYEHDYRDDSRSLVSAQDSMLPNVELMPDENWRWNFVEQPGSSPEPSSSPSKICTESEVLQKVTDYGGDEQTSTQDESHMSLSKSSPTSSTTAGSLQGAGDSALTTPAFRRSAAMGRSRLRASYTRSRTFSRHSSFNNSMRTRLPQVLPGSASRVTQVSDCRLRNPRLETQFELSSESLIPAQEVAKRK